MILLSFHNTANYILYYIHCKEEVGCYMYARLVKGDRVKFIYFIITVNHHKPLFPIIEIG